MTDIQTLNPTTPVIHDKYEMTSMITATYPHTNMIKQRGISIEPCYPPFDVRPIPGGLHIWQSGSLRLASGDIRNDKPSLKM
jgi:hypothetical protein